MYTRRELLRAAALAAAGLGTASLLGGSGRGAPAFAGAAFSGVGRAPADPSTQGDAVRAVQSFGTDLYRLLTQRPGNLACSPYSVAVALAMARNGARGATATEMDRVLHAPGLDRLNSGLNALQQALAGRSGRRWRGDGTAAEVRLDVANSLWGQRSERWQPAFLDALARSYGSGMHTVDYVGATEEARHAINGWTGQHTHGRIPELVPAGVLDTLTRLVLVNAVYLKAPWLDPFTRGGTAPGPFTRTDGSRVEVPLMSLSAPAGYASGPGWQAVRLPYLGNQLAMTLLVPDAGRLAEVERSLSTPVLGSLLAQFPMAELTLRLPRWTFRTQVELTDLLVALGMPTAFTDRADFSGMTAQEGLSLSAVLHEVFVAVDEQGTEAAAASGAVARAQSALIRTVTLVVDRPFLFLIHDVETGTPLFLGRVTDPSAG
jgi:serpin B